MNFTPWPVCDACPASAQFPTQIGRHKRHERRVAESTDRPMGVWALKRRGGSTGEASRARDAGGSAVPKTKDARLSNSTSLEVAIGVGVMFDARV